MAHGPVGAMGVERKMTVRAVVRGVAPIAQPLAGIECCETGMLVRVGEVVRVRHPDPVTGITGLLLVAAATGGARHVYPDRSPLHDRSHARIVCVTCSAFSRCYIVVMAAQTCRHGRPKDRVRPLARVTDIAMTRLTRCALCDEVLMSHPDTAIGRKCLGEDVLMTVQTGIR